MLCREEKSLGNPNWDARLLKLLPLLLLQLIHRQTLTSAAMAEQSTWLSFSLRVSTDLEHTESTNLALLLSVNQSQKESTSLFVLTDSMSKRHQQQHQQVSAKCADFLSRVISSLLWRSQPTLCYTLHTQIEHQQLAARKGREDFDINRRRRLRRRR